MLQTVWTFMELQSPWNESPMGGQKEIICGFPPLSDAPWTSPFPPPDLAVFTFTFFFDQFWLRHREALHNLVTLAGLLVLCTWLIWGTDQHPAVEGVAVASGGFLGPRDSINCRCTWDRIKTLLEGFWKSECAETRIWKLRLLQLCPNTNKYKKPL